MGQIGEALTSTLSASDPPKTIITDNFAMAVAVIDAANPQTLNTSAMTVTPEPGGANVPLQVRQKLPHAI